MSLRHVPNVVRNSYTHLVGGFSPVEKYSSKWVHLPQLGVKIKNICNHHLVIIEGGGTRKFLWNPCDRSSLEEKNIRSRRFRKPRFLCHHHLNHQTLGWSFPLSWAQTKANLEAPNDNNNNNNNTSRLTWRFRFRSFEIESKNHTFPMVFFAKKPPPHELKPREAKILQGRQGSHSGHQIRPSKALLWCIHSNVLPLQSLTLQRNEHLNFSEIQKQPGNTTWNRYYSFNSRLNRKKRHVFLVGILFHSQFQGTIVRTGRLDLQEKKQVEQNFNTPLKINMEPENPENEALVQMSFLSKQVNFSR